MEKTQKIKFILSLTFAAIFFIALPADTSAATLYFSPSTGEYAVNSTLSVSIYASSADQAMNAASGIISFPQDKLKVTSLSKTGSIFTLWVQDPSFSNSAGAVNFEGIVLNPGFTGTSGKIITIHFKTKAAGTALLNLSSGSALANDGKGTNILTGMGDANFSISVAEPREPKAITPSETALPPAAPKISSQTHPDPNKWYAVKDAKLAWKLPRGVNGTRLLVGKIQGAIPTVTYIPPIRERELTDLEDGIWYFSARLRNDAGWSDVSRFRLQIDTEKPSRFEITEARRADSTEQKVKFIFDADDKTSGIDRYEVQIDDGDAQTWHDDGSHEYETPAFSSGRHTLIAKAIDKAGNSLLNLTKFTIAALEAPVITEWPRELSSGEQLTVKGTSKHPNSQIVVWLEHDGKDAKSETTKSDTKGNFVFTAEERPKDGVYKLWAEVIDKNGARSSLSEKVTIIMAVKRPAYTQTFMEIVPRAVSLLAVIVPMVVLVFALLFIIWHGWHKFASFRKKLKSIKRKICKEESDLNKAFDLLKDDIREQIKMLEKTRMKRRLTYEEDKIIKRLRQATTKEFRRRRKIRKKRNKLLFSLFLRKLFRRRRKIRKKRH